MRLVFVLACAPLMAQSFHVEEASIADIQRAIQSKKLTSTKLVELYLKRVKAYNGTCVGEPNGILGAITTIPHAKHESKSA